MARAVSKKTPDAPEETTERRDIRAAMDRILRGIPRRVEPGRMSVVALAEEAGVDRSAITLKHTDLKDEFYGRVRAATTHAPTNEEHEALQAELAAAKEAIAKLKHERNNWKNAASDFARQIQVLNVRLANAGENMEVMKRELERAQERARNIYAIKPGS